MTRERGSRDHPGADGWGGRDSASNRSKGAGQLVMMQIGIDRDRRRRGGSFAVRLGDVGLVAVGPAVLSGAAADHDRRARLEPLGGADRRAWSARSRSASFSARCSSSPSWPAPACRPGGSAISPCWRGRPAATARRAALEWYPPGRLVVWAARARRPGRGRRHPQFRHRRAKASAPACATRSARMLRSRPAAGGTPLRPGVAMPTG